LAGREMKDKKGHDPRSQLYNRLIKLKVPKNEAWFIAIDTGGQEVIDREYLHSCGIRRKALQDKVLLEIAKFEVGDFD
jgi:hypothetical protein